MWWEGPGCFARLSDFQASFFWKLHYPENWHFKISQNQTECCFSKQGRAFDETQTALCPGMRAPQKLTAVCPYLSTYLKPLIS